MPWRLDRTRAASFDAWAMPQPSHIYASTLHRRGRRWSRRRAIWSVRRAAALSTLLVLSAAVVLAALG